MRRAAFNRAVISEESATVYVGGGRRYLTLKAAARGAAKKYMRDLIREQGEDSIPELMFQREVARMATQLLCGEAMTFDWDEANERAEDDGDPRTPQYGVSDYYPPIARDPGIFD
jgi:hypothetical protein